MNQGKCPKCGSGRIMHNIRVVDRDGEYADGNLTVRVERKPDAIIFKHHWDERVIKLSDIEWLHIGREPRVQTSGRFQVIPQP